MRNFFRSSLTKSLCIANKLGDWTEADMGPGYVRHKLSAVRGKALKVPGKYEDGGGLGLVIGPNSPKRWVVRVTVTGRCLDRNRGTYTDISLDAARDAAAKARKAAEVNFDIKAAERCQGLAVMTFREMFQITLAQREKQLSNAKHLKPSCRSARRLSWRAP